MELQLSVFIFICVSENVFARNTIMLPHLIIHSSLHYLSTGHLREVKNNGNVKLLAIKVVTVAYERWSLTRGSNIVIWLGNFWHFGNWSLRRSGRLQEVVAT